MYDPENISAIPNINNDPLAYPNLVKDIIKLPNTKIIIVGTAEGIEKENSDARWDFSICQNNDIQH